MGYFVGPSQCADMLRPVKDGQMHGRAADIWKSAAHPHVLLHFKLCQNCHHELALQLVEHLLIKAGVGVTAGIVQINFAQLAHIGLVEAKYLLHGL